MHIACTIVACISSETIAHAGGSLVFLFSFREIAMHPQLFSLFTLSLYISILEVSNRNEGILFSSKAFISGVSAEISVARTFIFLIFLILLGVLLSRLASVEAKTSLDAHWGVLAINKPYTRAAYV